MLIVLLESYDTALGARRCPLAQRDLAIKSRNSQSDKQIEHRALTASVVPFSDHTSR